MTLLEASLFVFMFGTIGALIGLPIIGVFVFAGIAYYWMTSD